MWDPIGAHRSGSVGPKNTIVRVPNNAERCVTPES